MSIRNKLFLACESFLRVPPLLIVDEIFRTSFGFGGRPFQYGGVTQSHKNVVVTDTVILNSKDPTTTNTEWIGSGGGDGLQQDVSSSSHQLSDDEFTISSAAGFLKDTMLWSLEVVQNGTSSIVNPFHENVVGGVDEKPEDVISRIEEVSKFADEVAHDFMFAGQIFGCLVLFVAAVIMFMLATDNLIKLYSHLLSFTTIYLSYIIPSYTLGANLNDLFFLSVHVTIRTVLAAVFFACKSWSSSQSSSPTSATGGGGGGTNRIPALFEPILLSLFFITGFGRIAPVVFIPLVILLHYPLIKSLPKLYKFLMLSWGETKRVQNEYGLSHLIQVESGRLRINTVFRLFWMTRAAYDAFFRCCDEPASLIIRNVMVHGTETFTGIVGLTVTVAAVCHQIGDFLLWLLYFGANNEVDLNRFGSISTVLFFILSLQSGLTSLDPEKRLDRLLKNVALLGTALFHALHQLVAPLLHAFRSFQAVQIRAATLSCVFLCLSFCLTLSLLRWTTISTWSLAVLALAIEFKIKVIISLVISLVVYLSQLVQYPDAVEKIVSCFRRILPRFVMHFFDKMYDQISHEDMVFYLKTVANIAEFVTGIFLFLNAVWIFLFESTSAIRAIGMSIHAYFNIWCEAQKGFRIYCQRKTASKKIMSLQDATEEQLSGRSDDVCSICYEGFESAKVTNCGHLFHAVCLRKWLYVQNTCPMCHEILYKEDATAEESPVAEAVQPLPVIPIPPPPRQQNRANNNNAAAPVANTGPDRHPDQNQNTGSDSSESEIDDLNQHRRRPHHHRRRHPAGAGAGNNNNGAINNNIIYNNGNLLRPQLPNAPNNNNQQLLVHRANRDGGSSGVWNDGNETDVEDNDDDHNGELHDIENDDSDTDSFVELEDLEVWNRELDRDHEDRDRGDGGGIQAANGRGLVLFL